MRSGPSTRNRSGETLAIAVVAAVRFQAAAAVRSQRRDNPTSVVERREHRALLACWRTHVPIDDVAKILGVSRATAHRRTAAAVDAQPAK